MSTDLRAGPRPNVKHANRLWPFAVLVAAVLCVAGALTRRVFTQGTDKAARPTIQFEHDGRNTVGYVIYARQQNGPTMRLDVGPQVPDATGTIRVPLPDLPDGRYTLSVAAYSLSAESDQVPASPRQIVVAGSPATHAGSPAPHTASPAPETISPAPQTRSSNASEGSGFFSRVWRLLVGDDDP